ncbi:bifunctional lysylphosphatidylglycerol flippase/synthetase MprF [Lentilactobacillus sp. SPB1-3]|uniref:Bifunctional lysylphosphatidylglycerol flippase/synthetase MprF n=1 Tax=Lentilactobacillus terminaliae TaxID=3003483 RepID=A0ACD5DGX8_9LACO|nr:bifunctional lysylphosphatidylglycerol flippase/synthetase MprF [Lentilactobacillus sp. SPB1-3]MCZ0976899.1 bifunctional lysylphosphatidylglycerol flippase/synthetase MprF [Lentilactobacillus sp. SPB1-3]
MLKKFWSFIDKRMSLLKFIFVFSVLIFVIRESAKVFREVSGSQLQTIVADQSQVALLVLLVVGFISILPMMIYDFSIVKFLPGHFKKSYVIKSGWVVNTFTNLLGFGGLLGSSLRAHFYGENASKKQVVYAISKVALFLVSGLSVLCFEALILIFGFGIGSQFTKYWIWLAGGAIYFPAMFLFTRFNHSSFFDDLKLKDELIMTGGSVLEWNSAMAFFLFVGYMMGIHTDFAAIIPIFVVANIAGVISMIPGGLGSFDVFMILGLGMVGVGKSDAIVWILMYRLFYYLLPFLVGVGLFIHDTGSKLNNYLNGLPKLIVQRGAQVVLTGFMYFSGIMMLLFATIPDLVVENKIYLRLFPYSIFFLSHVLNIIVAFLLIGLGSGLWSLNKRAFVPTVIVLVISIINTFFNEAFTWRMIAILIIILVLLMLSKGVLYRDRMANSWGKMIFNSSIFFITFLAYVIVGIVTHRGGPRSFNMPTFSSGITWLLGFIGLLVAFLVLIGINAYLIGRKPAWLNLPFDGPRIQAIIDKFGGNEDSQLAFLQDKTIFYYQENGEDQVFFMFRPVVDKLVVMGEPVGNPEKFSVAIDYFMEQADKQGYKLVFYEINEDLTMLLHEKGFDFIKTGETGLVDVQNFTLAGKRHRGERALMNKFDRDNYSFEILQPPFSKEFIQRLREISDEWLDGKEEKGFSLGFFDEYYLNQAPIAVMKTPEGKIVAFANIMSSGNSSVTSIDLMRSSADAPSGIMDGIFVNLYNQAKDDGYQYFDLGMSPLSNVGTSKFSFFEERIVHIIYEYGASLYSFEGLRSYKDKYVDKWAPKYISYFKGSSLAFATLQVFTIVNRRADKQPGKLKIIKYLPFTEGKW